MASQILTKRNTLFPALLDDFFKPWADWAGDFNSGRSLAALTIPAVNVSEDKDSYKLSVATPGMKRMTLRLVYRDKNIERFKDIRECNGVEYLVHQDPGMQAAEVIKESRYGTGKSAKGAFCRISLFLIPLPR